MCCCTYFTRIPGEAISEFEQNAIDGTRNLTDFSTRVTWTATQVRNEIRSVGSYVQGIGNGHYYQQNHIVMPAPLGFTSVHPIYSSKCVHGYHEEKKITDYTYKRASKSPQKAGQLPINSGKKPYKCDQPGCTKSFARNEELTRHKNIHTGIKAYVCRTCTKAFGRKDHLSKHEKTHLNASEKKMHRCYIVGCNHEYTRSDALARHLSTAHSSSIKR